MSKQPIRVELTVVVSLQDCGVPSGSLTPSNGRKKNHHTFTKKTVTKILEQKRKKKNTTKKIETVPKPTTRKQN